MVSDTGRKRLMQDHLLGAVAVLQRGASQSTGAVSKQGLPAAL